MGGEEQVPHGSCRSHVEESPFTGFEQVLFYRILCVAVSPFRGHDPLV